MTSTDLLALAAELQTRGNRLEDNDFAQPLKHLENASKEVGKAWSGSNLGYHARVYYRNFAPPPAGARFSQEWGFEDAWPIRETIGDWHEYTSDEVLSTIYKNAGNPDLEGQRKEAIAAGELFDEAKATILSTISSTLAGGRSDSFLQDLHDKIKGLIVLSHGDVIRALQPKGKAFSRDMAAIEKGFHTPPHLEVMAKVLSIRHPFMACLELSKLTRRAASHMANQEQRERRSERIGTNVFIGHGRSAAWKDLKDFIQDRLRLPWDEFNRLPIAGVTNIARLSQMLDSAAIAFIVLTGEDEQVDGRLHARMNVIHEAGLFQGRLGFERAIVLLEEGCEEFSNIQGLGQIRFPPGKIRAAFEDIRLILEREGLVE
jgi:predicted nucleotide-binding protein